MNFLKYYFFAVFLSLSVGILFAQNKQNPLEFNYYYPKDSSLFKKNTNLDYNYEKAAYGQTMLVIQCSSEQGRIEFIFKKKVLKSTYYAGDSSDVYGENGVVVGKEYIAPYTVSEHNLYAFVIQYGQKNEATIKAKFQDFGNELYTPEFDYEFCSISDEDKDGKPEFYLSYIAESDGLDPTPFKQIIYTIIDGSTKIGSLKSKATAYYPAGNEGDIYNVEYDTNWKALPKPIREKSEKILLQHKKNTTR
jgi:hypothetical protein